MARMQFTIAIEMIQVNILSTMKIKFQELFALSHVYRWSIEEWGICKKKALKTLIEKITSILYCAQYLRPFGELGIAHIRVLSGTNECHYIACATKQSE